MNDREVVPALKQLFHMTLLDLLKDKNPEERSILIKKLIHQAREEGKIYLTLESSINIKFYGQTLLHRAAWKNEPEMARALIEAKCDLNCQNSSGETPLNVAGYNNHIKIVAILIEAKCDLNRYGYQGHVLISAAFHNHKEIAQGLIESKCELNHRDKIGGYTALMWALYENHLTIAHQLIIAGANVNLPNDTGFFPFDYALQNKDLFTLGLLLTHDAQITKPQNFFSFLSTCDKNNNDYWICLSALQNQQKNLYETKLSDDKYLLLNKKTFQQISHTLSERKKHDERVYKLIKVNTGLPDVLNHMIHEYDSSFADQFRFFKKQNKKTRPCTDQNIGNKVACCLIC